MKSITSLFILLFLFSCGSTKNAAVQTDPLEELLVGTIHIEECGPMIHTKIDKSKYIIYPNNLDEKFHVEGMKIKFYFRNSSMPIPKNCNAQSRGNVDEVTPLR